MDAKKIKPYTFWIVSGVIVVIELGLLAFWPITDELDRSPEQVKGQLDDDFKKLNDLYVRAGRTPTGVMDAERPEHIKQLTEDFLITPKWKGVLQPHVDKYNQQLGAIKKDLAARSAILHEQVADSGDLFSWYTAYVGKTKEVMLALRNAGVLAVDESNREELDFENNSTVRSRVGFYTKVERTPEASEHTGLTVRFRIMQKIADALIASKTQALPSPVVKTNRDAELETKRPPRITRAEWKRGGDPSKTLSGPIADTADAYELTLVLEGSTSALIAAEGAIEGISEPVVIVAGGNLKARGPQLAGVRKNVVDEPMELTLAIAVIDFRRILAGETIAEGAKP